MHDQMQMHNNYDYNQDNDDDDDDGNDNTNSNRKSLASRKVLKCDTKYVWYNKIDEFLRMLCKHAK